MAVAFGMKCCTDAVLAPAFKRGLKYPGRVMCEK